MMSPYDLICVYEYISWWYGHGSDWIKLGLPIYVEISRKPENGTGIKDTAFGVSYIMIILKIVKGL